MPVSPITWIGVLLLIEDPSPKLPPVFAPIAQTVASFLRKNEKLILADIAVIPVSIET
jgi:hypothetical protein